MKIEQAVERAAHAVRQVKEQHVRQVRGKEGRTDIQTFMEFYRGDAPVALCSCGPHRDVMLEIIGMGVMGFGADTVCWSMEGWYAKDPKRNPVTGKEWGPGEMEEVAMRHDGIGQGWVFETLVTTVANRAGDMIMVSQPYRRHGRDVLWQERLSFNTTVEGQEAGGYVPDTVREIMTKPDVATQMFTAAPAIIKELAYSIPEEQRVYHMDVATVRHMEMRAERWPVNITAALYAEPGSERFRLLRERFPQSPVVPPGDL